VSVSERNRTPLATSSFFSSMKFSMIPLWITTMRPVVSRWGWAFSSDGRPCVAQRVCPSPHDPFSGLAASLSIRFRSFPSLRDTWIEPSSPSTATPAES